MSDGEVFPNNPEAAKVFDDIRKFYYILDHIDEELKPVAEALMNLVEHGEQFKPHVEELLLEADSSTSEEFIETVANNFGIIKQFEDEYGEDMKNALEGARAIQEAKNNFEGIEQDVSELESLLGNH